MIFLMCVWAGAYSLSIGPLGESDDGRWRCDKLLRLIFLLRVGVCRRDSYRNFEGEDDWFGDRRRSSLQPHLVIQHPNHSESDQRQLGNEKR
jgi:hypothetical protein